MAADTTTATTTAATAMEPFDMTKVIPLVTGGGSGIGYGLVKEFLDRGCPKVLITGRREDVLRQAAEQHAGKVFYKVSDAGKQSDREELLEWIQKEHADCNALINNAGIQRRVAMVQDTNATWEERAQEIEINVCGPIHLCTLFVPWFLSKKEQNEVCWIANVSSGLAFVPFAGGPVYAATKAAIHSYTMSLRYSLENTHIRVIEIIPPAVKSNLGGSHDFGEDCDEYCTATMERIFVQGELEVGYKMSETMRLADRQSLDQAMIHIATSMHVPKYE